jgi:hypothetical protein
LPGRLRTGAPLLKTNGSRRWTLGTPTRRVGTSGSSVRRTAVRCPFDIIRRWRDRIRKRQQRQAEAAARAECRREADAALRDELIEAAGGCVVCGPALEDVAPIQAALADSIPMDVVTTAIRAKCDRRIYPKNEPASSWRDERILRAIADLYCRRLIRNMVAAWRATGNTHQQAADAPDASAAARDHPTQKTHPRSPPHAHHVVEGEDHPAIG